MAYVQTNGPALLTVLVGGVQVATTTVVNGMGFLVPAGATFKVTWSAQPTFVYLGN
jgi:hypothetical protein